MGLSNKLYGHFYFIIILTLFIEPFLCNKKGDSNEPSIIEIQDQIPEIYNSKRIGVLSLPISSHFEEVVDKKVEQNLQNSQDAQELNDVHNLQKDASYYPDSYFKWLGTSHDDNLEIIPLEYYSTNVENIASIMENLDGILLTGGGTPLFSSFITLKHDQDLGFISKISQNNYSEYTRKIRAILKQAELINQQGRVFPIWATCLGFESMLLYYAEPSFRFQRHKNYRNNAPIQILNLDNVEDHLYKTFTEEERQILQTQNISYFNHQEITFMSEIQKDQQFLRSVHLIASAIEKNTKEEILAAFQHKNYPFYAVQFHPEKASFEKHSGSIQDEIHKTLNNKLARFFVNKVQQREYNTQYKLLDMNQRGQMEIQNIGHFEQITLFVPKKFFE